MGFDITFPILALFSSVIIALLAFSFLSKKLSGGFIPALAVGAGIMWIALYVNIDRVEGFELSNTMTTNTTSNTIFHMNQITRTGATTVRNGSITFMGEEINSCTSSSLLCNKLINGITLTIDKNGNNVPGTAYIGVWGSTSIPNLSNSLFIIGQIKVNDTNLAISDYTFIRNDSKSWQLSNGQAVGILYDFGDSSNNIAIDSNGTASSFDADRARTTTFSESTMTWTDSINGDLKMKLFLQTNHIVETNEPVDFNDNPTKIYMVGVGVLFMVLGAMQRLDKD